MRPSSSPSELGLFDGVLARGAVRDATGDRAWLQAMLDVEAALARGLAAVGLIPAAAVAAIVGACQAPDYDVSALAAEATGPGNPVLPMVTRLRAAAGAAGEYVHLGATTQDVLDTAAMLVARRALEPLLADLSAAADSAARLARTHRDTPAPGRTLLQDALPVTVGLVTAGWLVGLTAAADRLAAVRDTRLAVQLGGAVGTMDGWGAAGPELVDRVAADLGLTAPELAWHTERTRVGELAGALGIAAGAIAKVARDITLLASSDVGEVREASGGGSTAMPHKRNPVASISALACALPAPGLVATLLTAMVQEHQRAAGAWQAEWRPLRELLVTVGSAASWLRESLAGLTVDAAASTAHAARLPDPTRIGIPGELIDRVLAVRRYG
jgi:3-carboxy-cis,cis-muconate cycloisomerase